MKAINEGESLTAYSAETKGDNDGQNEKQIESARFAKNHSVPDSVLVTGKESTK